VVATGEPRQEGEAHPLVKVGELLHGGVRQAAVERVLLLLLLLQQELRVLPRCPLLVAGVQELLAAHRSKRGCTGASVGAQDKGAQALLYPLQSKAFPLNARPSAAQCLRSSSCVMQLGVLQ